MTHEVGYARVSKREQSPEAQEAELRAAGCGRVFVDRGESSRIADRPQWLACLDYLARETPEVPVEARAAVRARRRKEIDELDYRRELRRLEEHGFTQSQISRWLGIAQPSVNSALRTAAKVLMPLDGFSGATPAEICQRYAAGFIERAQLIDELTRFPYAKSEETDGYDSLLVDPPGVWAEVSTAVRRGLIEDDVYEEVFNRRHEQGR